MRRWAGVGIAIVMLITGCGHGVDREAAPPRARVRAAVVAAAAERRPLTATAVGVLAARRRTVASARATATVVEVAVREGDRVTAGQALFVLDDRDPVAQGSAARAGVRAAEGAVVEAERGVALSARSLDAAAAGARVAARTRARLDRMFEKGAVSAQLRDEAVARDEASAAELARAREAGAVARARVAQARDRVAGARAEAVRTDVALTDTRVVAPFAGVVASRPVDPGTLAQPGAPLVVLEDADPRLECVVPAAWVDRVRPGDEVSVHLDAPAEDLQGRVDEVVPTAEPASHTVMVRVALPGARARRSGTFGRAAFVVGARPAVAVPSSAVVERGQLEIAYVAGADGLARVRLVKTGEARAGRVEVLSGLEAGERVVAVPPGGLRDGDALEAAP